MGFSLDDRKVEANVFTDTGKWKYTVELDYRFPDFDWEHWDLHTMALKALENATNNGTSGVTFKSIGPGKMMVVLEPYAKNSHPIIVMGE